MVDGALSRASGIRVDLGVGRALIASGLRTRPSYSCDGWVCDLGVVGAPGLGRGFSRLFFGIFLGLGLGLGKPKQVFVFGSV